MRNKILLLLSGVFGVLFVGGAEAATVDVDFSREQFVVSGRIESGEMGQAVQIMVLNPGKDLKDAEGDEYKSAIQQVSITETAENGEFKFELPIQMNENGAGYYTFYIETPENDENEVLTAYYADIDTRKNMIELINNADKDEMDEILKDAEETLALNFEAFEKCDIEDVANLVYEDKTKEKYNKEDIAGSQLRIKQMALLAAYNSGKNDACFGENGEFKFSDVIDMSAIDKEGVTLYDIYNTIISENGKKEIRTKLLNSEYSTVEDLYNKFSELVFLYGVSSAKTEGSGHIKNVITNENAKRVGVIADKYISTKNSSKRSLMEAELLEENFETPQEMMLKFNSIIDKYGKNDTSNSGGGGGGSSQGSTATGGMVLISGNPNGAQPVEKAVFDDIENVAWAKDAILYLYDKKIVNGTGENKFSPDENITREQFAVILSKANGFELEDGDVGFKDVLPGAYYEKHIMAAKKRGIINGISEDIFGVGNNITRQDLCVMIYRAWFEGETGENQSVFIDAEEISAYAKDAVLYLSELGIVNGFEDGSFRAKELCTRAQAAKIIFEVIGRI